MAREMKDSGIKWIGEVPNAWKINRIKNSFFIVSGATPKSEYDEFWDGNIPWITPADYKTKDKYVSYGRRNLSLLGYNSCGSTLVPTNSLVFSKRAPIGAVAITNRELCTNQGCLCCVPKNKANTIFYYYVLSAFTEQFEFDAFDEPKKLPEVEPTKLPLSAPILLKIFKEICLYNPHI